MRVRTTSGSTLDSCLRHNTTKNVYSTTSRQIFDKTFRQKVGFLGNHSVSRKASRAQVSAPVQQLATQSAKGSKEYDVVALGNLCVDIVVPFAEVRFF
jgi:hypothetical protein